MPRSLTFSVYVVKETTLNEAECLSQADKDKILQSQNDNTLGLGLNFESNEETKLGRETEKSNEEAVKVKQKTPNEAYCFLKTKQEQRLSFSKDKIKLVAEKISSKLGMSCRTDSQIKVFNKFDPDYKAWTRSDQVVCAWLLG